jgi:hypothetical protein
MSNISDYKAWLITRAASISFEGDKLECLALIDTWYACRVKADTLSATDVSSYSIAGRSVTKITVENLRIEESRLLNEIKAYLGIGPGGMIDARGSELTMGSVP